MSLRTFQRAVVELTIAPEKVRSLRAGDRAVFAGYDLTQCEWDRLFSIVHQPGIFLNCSLSRGGRFEAIASAFSMTCVLLKPWLRELLDEIWKEHAPTNYQLAGEEAIFAQMLDRKIAAGQLSIEYLEDVFRYERACHELVQRMREQTDSACVEAIVDFQYCPDEILGPLGKFMAPPVGLPKGAYQVLIKLRDGRFQLTVHPRA